jgi:hypothetical protein
MEKLISIKKKHFVLLIVISVLIALISFFSCPERLAHIPFTATYSVGATVVDMRTGNLFSNATVGYRDATGTTFDNAVPITNGKFRLTYNPLKLPYMVIVKPNVANMLPAVYHLNINRASTTSKARVVNMSLPTASAESKPILAVTVLNTNTENAVGGATVTFTNNTPSPPAVTTQVTDGNGVAKISNFNIGDVITVKVLNMAVDNSYSITTTTLPANSYITSNAFVTPLTR